MIKQQQSVDSIDTIWLSESASRAALGFLVLLLITDLGFVILHFVHDTGMVRNARLLVTKEIGHAEIFQNIKEYWCVLILAMLFYRYRAGIFLIWTIVFAVLLLIDSLQWHDYAGRKLVGALDIPAMAHLAPRKVGQLIVSILISLGALTALLVFYRQSSIHLRRFSRRLLLYLFFLGIVGILFDVFLSTENDGDSLNSLIHEWTEMFLLSLIASYLFAYWLSGFVLQRYPGNGNPIGRSSGKIPQSNSEKQNIET